jgi:hypothetical protein
MYDMKRSVASPSEVQKLQTMEETTSLFFISILPIFTGENSKLNIVLLSGRIYFKYSSLAAI